VAHDELLAGRPTDAALSDQLLSPVWTPQHKLWRLAFLVAAGGTAVLTVAVTATVTTGIGLWGNNIPVAWAFGIINFVWWIGIGHAGTFISAILLLLEQKWRTSINRFAEAMTLFAVMQAGLFPLLHLGRPWFAYWLVPYPATMRVWPQFKSALPWDAAAIATYFTVSLLFWYFGLVPDLASLRDRAPQRWRRIVYGVLALGWRGSARHLRHYRVVYGLLAGLSTPLVVSVHSIVSTDFAITLLPGWHSTIFPPFFVAGAILSGFGMVLTLIIPARRVFRLQNVITERHLDNLAKLTLVTAWIVTYSYVVELFIAWYGGDPFERYQLGAVPTLRGWSPQDSSLRPRVVDGRDRSS
jgi:molybdopterin-containing oxidoreductase family membrane subunit